MKLKKRSKSVRIQNINKVICAVKCVYMLCTVCMVTPWGERWHCCDCWSRCACACHHTQYTAQNTVNVTIHSIQHRTLWMSQYTVYSTEHCACHHTQYTAQNTVHVTINSIQHRTLCMAPYTVHSTEHCACHHIQCTAQNTQFSKVNCINIL